MATLESESLAARKLAASPEREAIYKDLTVTLSIRAECPSAAAYYWYLPQNLRGIVSRALLVLLQCSAFSLPWALGRVCSMNDVTHLLAEIQRGKSQAAEQLLPLVYDELRKLARARLAKEKPGHTLDATGLVHEAYLRLMGPLNGRGAEWDGRGHFFAAAAEAMRRILVENARRKSAFDTVAI